MKPIRIFSHIVCDSAGYLTSFLEQRGIPYEIVCLDEGIPAPQNLEDIAGLVFLGGPGDVNDPTDWMQGELDLSRKAANRNIPMLGVCLGAQLLSKALGGVVSANKTLEVGWHPVVNVSRNDWFAGLPASFEVFQWHAHTFSLPQGATALARGSCAELQAFSKGNILATQFHLETTPEAIEYLIQRFESDLEIDSSCVQDVGIITRDMESRSERLHQVADVVYGRWLQCVQDFDS